MTHRTTFALTLTALMLASATAWPCSFAAQTDHMTDPDEIAADSTPPGEVVVKAVSINRGQGPVSDGCSEASTSCDDTGFLILDLEPARDDRTAPGQIGYQLTLESGTLPDSLRLPDGPVRASEGGISLHWSDGATDDQESFSFVLGITAVDLGGNMGETQSVQIGDAGGTMGCDMGRKGGGGNYVVFGVLLLGLMLCGTSRRWSKA